MNKPQQQTLTESPRIRAGDRVSYSTPDPTPKEPDRVTWRVGTVEKIITGGVAAIDIGLTVTPMVRLEDLRPPF